MLKYLFMLFISILSFLPVQAQISGVPDSLRLSTPSQNDTLQAIHYLFRTRRLGGLETIRVGTGLTIGIGVLGLATYNIASRGRLNVDGGRYALGTLKLSLPALLLIGVGISKRARFNRENEKAVLLAYQQGTPLPATIRRRLKPMHFPAKKDSLPLR